MTSDRNVLVKEGILEAISSLIDRLVSSFGPKGMDKMIRVKKKNKTYDDSPNTINTLSSNTIITNDGATILEYLVNNNNNPIHRILSDISHAQDVSCGDGTTTVILLLGILYKYINNSNTYNINSTINNSSLYNINNNSIIFTNTLEKIKEIAIKHIEEVKVPATDLMNAALTALNSKVASKNINMAKVAIEALSKYNMNDVRRYKKTGGSIDDINIIYGIVLSVIKGNIHNILDNNLYTNLTSNNKIVKNAIVAQFCISAPKTNIDAKIDIKNYKQMELFVREEKEYIQNIIDILKKNGIEMVFIQKSLLKESVSVLATHLLNKAGIIVVDGVERKDITALCDIIGVNVVSDISILENYNNISNSSNITDNSNSSIITDNYNPFVKEITFSFLDNQHVSISSDACCTIVIDGIDQIVADEGERCLNDVMSVIKVLKDDSFVVPGGCAVEAGIGIKIEQFIDETFLGSGNKNTSCLDMQLLRAAAEAFYELPHLLAKNAGYYPVEVVERLKEKMKENWNLGVSMRKNKIGDMLNDDNIIQPASVSKNAVILAIEGVEMISKIDDILPSRNI